MKNPGIYVLTSPSGKQYVGKDSNLPSRVRDHLSGNAPNCRAIHDAIKKYGADAFSVEIIQYPGISDEALNAVERWWIRQLQTLSGFGYNLTEGGEGVIPSEETRQKFSESARLEQKKRLENGTHHFLGDKNPVHKQLKDGTHNFLDSDFQRRTAKKRLDEGTHNFLDSDFQRRAQIKRDAVNKKRLEDGTHHFLDSDFQRRTAQKRIDEGTHNFLGENNPSHKRVADGTHHFLGGDIARRTAQKRIDEGTHNFIGENNPMKRLSKDGRHPWLGEKNPAKQRSHKRYKAEWCYIIAVSRFWYEIHDYTLKRRAEFLSKEIPDTSNAEQVSFL